MTIEKTYDDCQTSITIAPRDDHLATTPIFDKTYFKENQAYEIFDGIRTQLGILKCYAEKHLQFIYTKNREVNHYDINLKEYIENNYTITRLTDVEGI